MAASGETYRQAFPPKPKPHVSYGIPFPQACAHHITNTFYASRVYIIVSSSISKTDNFKRLHHALGDKVVGVRYGIKSHTPWDDVLEIVMDMCQKDADLIVTLGAGSLTDGAKLISWVRLPGV
jgi:alcohol dehydrogenase class IV